MMEMKGLRGFICIAVLLFIAFTAIPAGAATINVNTTADDLTNNGNCTLREAIQAANTNSAVDSCPAGAAAPTVDTINVPAGTYTVTIAGVESANAAGDFDIMESVNIAGAGATNTIIDGNGLVSGDRVFEILGAGTVNITGVTIQNGRNGNGAGIANNGTGTLNVSNCIISDNLDPSGGEGGGIFNTNTGTASVSNCTISGNTVENGGWGGGISNWGSLTVTDSTISGNTGTGTNYGGGIYNSGTASVTNSTISGNTISGTNSRGGGIYNRFGGTLTVSNSTITDNIAADSGGGIYISGGTVNLRNTIVANQQAGGDCNTAVASTLNDMDSDGTCGVGTTADPILGPLADNGGPTQTHALLAGSPAIDAGDDATCAAAPVNGVDQRGITRPQDGDSDGTAHCDIGAFEMQITSVPTLTEWGMLLFILLAGLGAVWRMRYLR
jgi:CSLREA domain-containing protein